jgi:transposase
MAIIDAQSVKNTETAHCKGYDGGKKVSGIKRHIGVDTNGLPHAVHVTAANVTDRAGAIEMVKKSKQNLISVTKMLVDGGYTGNPFRDAMKEILNAEVEVVKRSELHTFAVIPKRWVVERSLSWLEKCRRLWKNCERLVSSSIGMVQLAFIRILLKRI